MSRRLALTAGFATGFTLVMLGFGWIFIGPPWAPPDDPPGLQPEVQVSEDLYRVVDDEAGVVCWSDKYRNSVDCLPLNEAELSTGAETPTTPEKPEQLTKTPEMPKEAGA